MKIARYRRSKDANPALGFVVSGGIVPAKLFGIEHDSIIKLASSNAETLEILSSRLSNREPELALTEIELLAPIPKPGKYLAIGMNYGKHADEAERLGLSRPDFQLWFNKQTTSISGPFDNIQPGPTDKLDYEVELGVVIGKTTKCVRADNALDYVFGYFVANDVSARDWQFRSSTITLGKSFDSHGPTGPWVVTADEIPDPQDLYVRCRVNGELRQSGRTADMIFSVREQIEYLSSIMTLEPGDLLATGTPEGVGVAMDPPTFLQEGDVVRCEIDMIGAIENSVCARRAAER